VAEEPKPAATKPAEQPSAASISPAPTDVAGDIKNADKPADGAAAAPAADAHVQATPLSDGTTPTVLTPGSVHRPVAKGKASLTNVYRRADVMTTLFTFAGAVVAGALIIGGYWFVTKQKAAKPASTPKVTTLDQSEIDKLGKFFDGNAVGDSAQVLTVTSSSFFKNRVAIGSDLKVVGGTEVTGTTGLSDLRVDKTATLAITNIRGQLTVAGPSTYTGPAIYNGGATYNGNLTTSGNGSFGGSVSAGSVSVRDLTVSSQLNINGHLNVGGSNPSASAVSGVSTGATVSGNDSAGTVSVTVAPGSGAAGGAQLVTVNFRNGFPVVPIVNITPVGRASAIIMPFVNASANGFTISAAVLPATATSTTYNFNYWVVQ
jgi:hypothetical protein